MPYKDPAKQRQAMRKIMRAYRARYKNDPIFIQKQINRLQKKYSETITRMLVFDVPVTC